MKSYKEFKNKLNEGKIETWIKKIENKTGIKANKGQADQANEFTFSDGSYAVVNNGQIDYYGGNQEKYSKNDWDFGYRSVGEFLNYLKDSGLLK